MSTPARPRDRSRPLGLTDRQLRLVVAAASSVAWERRSQFLEMVAGELRDRPSYTDADVAAAIQRALETLLQQPAA